MKMICGIALCELLCCTALSAQDFGPWSAPANQGSTVNSTCDDQHPALSKDGLSLVFSSTRPLAPGAPCLPALHLWVAQRDSLDSPWQAPQPLTAVNSPYNSTYEDHAPNLTTDGHWLFFHSTRPGGCNPAGGRRELWVAHRQNKRDDFGWQPPLNLGCILNWTGVEDAGPNFWEDDSTGTLYLYFTRNLTPTDPNGFKIHVSTCTSDLASCNRQQLWSPAEYVAELNVVGARDTRTAIRRRDALEMIISSNRTSTAGGLDLWVATRASAQEPWSIPLNLNQDNSDKCTAEGNSNCPVINSPFNDSAPALSWDGQTLIFWSNRASGLGFNDLYVTSREKLTGQR
jgi:hypothetical protein